jgi:hypothetical protein
MSWRGLARRWRTALIFRRPALLAQVSSQLTGADQLMFGTSCSSRVCPTVQPHAAHPPVFPALWWPLHGPMPARITRSTMPMPSTSVELAAASHGAGEKADEKSFSPLR